MRKQSDATKLRHLKRELSGLRAAVVPVAEEARLWRQVGAKIEKLSAQVGEILAMCEAIKRSTVK
jgi:hypothetical protein